MDSQPSPRLDWIMASDGLTVGLTQTNTQTFYPDWLDAFITSPDGFNRGGATVVAPASAELVALPSLSNGHDDGTVLVHRGVSNAMLVLDPGATKP